MGKFLFYHFVTNYPSCIYFFLYSISYILWAQFAETFLKTILMVTCLTRYLRWPTLKTCKWSTCFVLFSLQFRQLLPCLNIWLVAAEILATINSRVSWAICLQKSKNLNHCKYSINLKIACELKFNVHYNIFFLLCKPYFSVSLTYELTYSDVSNNQLSDKLPNSFANLTNLNTL